MNLTCQKSAQRKGTTQKEAQHGYILLKLGDTGESCGRVRRRAHNVSLDR